MNAAAEAVQNWLTEAVALHQKGHIAEAQRIYAQVLAASPGQPDALHLSGVAARQSGRPLQAVLNMAMAAARDPTLPGLHENLDRAVASLGPLDATVDGLARQIADDPAQHGLRLVLLQVLARQAAIDAQEAPPPDTPELEGPTPSVSVVICSIDPAKFARVTANLGALLAGLDHEIVGIHDARSLCEGYRRGLARCRGELVVLCHDDIEILSPDFATRLRRHLAAHDIVGVVGTSRLAGAAWLQSGWPHQHGVIAHAVPGERPYRVELYGASAPVVPGIQALDGVFIAGRRAVIEAIGFDAATFDGFHLYDMDMTFRAYRAGFRLAVAWDLCLVHQSAGRMDEGWRRHAQRFLDKHRDHLPETAAAGPNPLRGVWLATPAEVRAFFARVRSMAGPVFGHPVSAFPIPGPPVG
jgi:hypothetical protein